MPFSVTLAGDKALIASIRSMPAAVHAALVAKVYSLAFQLETRVKRDKLTGQVLNVITGALRASIHNQVQDLGDVVWGAVYSDGSVKYARIHEFGGLIKHPGGTAYVPIGASGKVQFVSNIWASGHHGDVPRTRPHDIPMPARSFLRSSLRDMIGKISAGLKKAVLDGIKASGMAATIRGGGE